MPDAWTAPPPEVDCNDPSFWSVAPAIHGFVGSFLGAAYCEIEAQRFYLPLRFGGDGAGCVRIIRSSRTEVPVGVTPFTAGGVIVGLPAPIEIELEARYYQRMSEGWGLVSERTMGYLPSLTVSVPDPVLNPPRLVALIDHAYADERELLTISTPQYRAPHSEGDSFGNIDGVFGFFTRPSTGAAILHLVGQAAFGTPLREIALLEVPLPVDDARTFVVPFGVVTGDRLHPTDGASFTAMVSLPAPIDEVAPGSRDAPTLARSGTRAFTLTPTSATELLGIDAAHVLDGDSIVDREGVVFDRWGVMYPHGRILADVGRPLAYRNRVVIGTTGIAAVGRDEVLIGPASVSFEDFGFVGAIGSIGPALGLERPDGTAAIMIEPGPACD